MSFDGLVFACLVYVAAMFLIAWAADRAAERGRTGWTGSPLVYTLSLSVYCTAWTFYGAVGYADRAGLEFLTIYLGPTIVFAGGWWGLRKLIRVARMHRVSSAADLISARYGKSNPLAAFVTLLLAIAGMPYIGLQLQSITVSFGAFASDSDALPAGLSFWLAAGLALFAILFGTRNLAADERHHGVVMAIALEAVVKLLAFLVLGAWVVWGLADGPGDVLARIASVAESPKAEGWTLKPDRWATLIFVSGVAIVTLPRMFQVLVVEATDENAITSAAWAFPAYLLAMSLFVLPIAVVGRQILGPEADPDLYVLSLPLSQGQDGLALLVFLGGFSAATSMVVIASIALATMISNHWIVPVWLHLRRPETPEARNMDGVDLRGPVLIARRAAIVMVLAGGALYQQLSGGGAALAAMGTVAFIGVAQMLPAMLGGLLWRGGTRIAAYGGLASGGAIWLAAVFLPSLGLIAAPPVPPGVDPQAFWIFTSLAVNAAIYIALSLLTIPGPNERLQGLSFVNALTPDHTLDVPARPGGAARAEALLTMARRIWGGDEALRFFRAEAEKQGKTGFLPDPSAGFLARLERRLAGSVGTATAHTMVAQVAGSGSTTVADLINLAGEAQRAKDRAHQLMGDQEELARTARRLQEANEHLTALSVQKDAFLGQISHELRTPMTSVRAFSELLMMPALSDEDRTRFAAIIHDESKRLTRLLDDLLDLSVLESGRAQLNMGLVNLHDLIDRALTSSGAVRTGRAFTVDRDAPSEHIAIFTDADRLLQVFINLITNARKYCDAPNTVLNIRARQKGRAVEVDFIDNGSGIETEKQLLVFEKFARLNDPARAGGAGLGLAICREIMTALGGSITYLPGQGGAAFRVIVPARPNAGQPGAAA
ncbi:MAG: ATP-binding protein [Paracoccus sp. (in: a-proteobacteria)]|nr:ATP-binding protein [Paracoccus sp. (in: a-proteobacteria)]